MFDYPRVLNMYLFLSIILTTTIHGALVRLIFKLFD